MNLTESIILKPIELGSSPGILTFHVTFTGETPDNIPVATAEVIYRIVNSGWPIRRVTLQGKFPSDATMTLLIMGLKQQNFSLHTIVDGSEEYPWLEMRLKGNQPAMDWVTLEINSSLQAVKNLYVDEVIYIPTTLDDPDPELPTSTNRFYLRPREEQLPEEVLKFVKESRISWHLTLENDRLKQFEVKIA